LFNVNTIDK